MKIRSPKEMGKPEGFMLGLIQSYTYCSAIKADGVMIHVTIWITLKNRLFSERSHTQKTMYYMIPWISSVRKREIYRNRKEFPGPEDRNRDKLRKSARVLFG